MTDVKINCQINNYLIECNGTKKNNVITFKDNEYNIMSFDYNRLELIKENEYTISFKDKTCTFNNGLVIDIDVKNIVYNTNQIIINYLIGDQIFNFSLEYTI